jgi:hypothetical protein
MLTRHPSHRALTSRARAIIAALLLTAAVAVPLAPAGATGTVRIQHPDGSVTTYPNVRITIQNESMAITSADGKGTVVFGKAACTKVVELMRCLPYDATLEQFGQSTHIALASGTVWLNPTTTKQQLTHSSTQLPPHGVLLAARSRRGTYMTLTGTVDEIAK